MSPRVAKPTTTLQAWIGLVLLFVIALYNYVDRTILSILQEPIKRDIGLSDAQLGALTGLSFAIFYTTLALPIARLADLANRKYLICAALIVWSLMTGLSGLATSFAVLVVLRVGVAIGEAGCVPTSHSLISDYFPRRRRATAIALWGLSLPLGSMIGYASGGWLAQAIGWREAFLIIGLSGVAIAPVIFLVLREPPRGQFDSAEDRAQPPPPVKEAIGILWRLRSFRLMTLGGALHAYTLHTIASWNAPFYARVYHLPIGEIAMNLALIAGIGGGAGMLLGGFIADRAGRRDVRWYMWTPALAGLLVAPLGLGQYMAGDARASLWFGLGAYALLQVYQAPLVATAQTLVGPGMRAFTSATLVLVVNILGMGLGPLLTGALSDFLVNLGLGEQSLRYAISTSLLFTLAAAFLFYRSAAHLADELPAAKTIAAEPREQQAMKMARDNA